MTRYRRLGYTHRVERLMPMKIRLYPHKNGYEYIHNAVYRTWYYEVIDGKKHRISEQRYREGTKVKSLLQDQENRKNNPVLHHTWPG